MDCPPRPVVGRLGQSAAAPMPTNFTPVHSTFRYVATSTPDISSPASGDPLADLHLRTRGPLAQGELFAEFESALRHEIEAARSGPSAEPIALTNGRRRALV